MASIILDISVLYPEPVDCLLRHLGLCYGWCRPCISDLSVLWESILSRGFFGRTDSLSYSRDVGHHWRKHSGTSMKEVFVLPINLWMVGRENGLQIFLMRLARGLGFCWNYKLPCQEGTLFFIQGVAVYYLL